MRQGQQRLIQAEAPSPVGSGGGDLRDTSIRSSIRMVASKDSVLGEGVSDDEGKGWTRKEDIRI